MSTPAKKLNGRKPVVKMVCSGSADCEVAQSQTDIRVQIQELAESIGLALEKLDDRLNGIALHLTDVGHKAEVTYQRVESLESMARAVGRKLNIGGLDA